MDFSSILSYLQNLLSNKQGQQNSQYAGNLGLQQQALGQQGSEFNSQLGQQGQEFTANLGLETQAQNEANQLAQQQFGLQQQGQQFGENLQAADNVVPGSNQWYSMANFLNTLQRQPQISQPTVNAIKYPNTIGWGNGAQ